MSLSKVHFHCAQEVESFAQMLEVIRAQDTFHQHVINVHFYCAPDHILEDLVNHAFKGSPRHF